MLDLLTKIVDLVFNYRSHKKDDKVFLLEKIIEPAMNDLSVLHQNYIDTFMGYCNILETGSIDILKDHPVFKSIVKDAIITRSLRDKIYSFYDTTNYSSANDFVNSIGHYFAGMPGFIDDGQNKEYALKTNIARHELYVLLVGLSEGKETAESQKVVQVIEVIKVFIGRLQDRYKEVVYNYNSFKNSMVK